MKLQYISISLFFSFSFIFSQEANISIDLGIKKYIGVVNSLNRDKYFGIQSSARSNELINEAPYLFGDLDIHLAKDKEGPQPVGNLADLSNSKIEDLGESVYEKVKSQILYKEHNTTSFLLTQEPIRVFKLNLEIDKTVNKIVSYLKSAYPFSVKYYDIMNEPFSNTRLYGNDVLAIRKEMTDFYREVISGLKKELPNLNVGGFSSSRPRFEINNFKNWQDTHQLFMDNVGGKLDFLSMHLYDEVDIDSGTMNYCSGSNSEAIFDLIDTYSVNKWNKIVPHIISSYGLRIPQWEGAKYNTDHALFILESLNHQVMAFMDKPDRIIKAIPTIFGREDGFYLDSNKNPNANPYPWSISHKVEDGNYEYTELIQFYEFWRGVQGERTYISSDNPDIQVNAFLEDGKWYLVFDNLSDENQVLNLNFSDLDIDRITKYTLRRLFVNDEGKPELTEAFTDLHIDQLEIEPHETFMLICDVPVDTQFSTSIVEYNNYSNDFLKDIVANKPLKFHFDNVKTGKGKVNIRLGIGRNKGLNLAPTVKINDNIVLTPNNWPGYNQENRKTFFGVLPIPIPMSYLKEKNVVEVTFPDTGGKVSSVVINTELFSTDIENKNFVASNKLVYVNQGGILLNISEKLVCKNPRIIDLKGNVVKKLKDYRPGHTIDISTIKKGSYYFVASDDEKFIFEK